MRIRVSTYGINSYDNSKQTTLCTNKRNRTPAQVTVPSRPPVPSDVAATASMPMPPRRRRHCGRGHARRQSQCHALYRCMLRCRGCCCPTSRDEGDAVALRASACGAISAMPLSSLASTVLPRRVTNGLLSIGHPRLHRNNTIRHAKAKRTAYRRKMFLLLLEKLMQVSASCFSRLGQTGWRKEASSTSETGTKTNHCVP